MESEQRLRDRFLRCAEIGIRLNDCPPGGLARKKNTWLPSGWLGRCPTVSSPSLGFTVDLASAGWVVQRRLENVISSPQTGPRRWTFPLCFLGWVKSPEFLDAFAAPVRATACQHLRAPGAPRPGSTNPKNLRSPRNEASTSSCRIMPSLKRSTAGSGPNA